MKKINKILLIYLIIIIITSFINLVYGVDVEKYRPPELTETDVNSFFKIGGTLLGTIRNVGAVVSVLAVAIIGLRYMFGSLEQKAQYKETMLPYIVGVCILVSITTIVTIIQNVATSGTNSDTSVTYTKKADGKLYCDNCEDELTQREQHNGRCYNCGKYIKGI